MPRGTHRLARVGERSLGDALDALAERELDLGRRGLRGHVGHEQGAVAAGGGDAERRDEDRRSSPEGERHAEQKDHAALIGTGGAGLKPRAPAGRTSPSGYIPRRLSMYGTVRSRILTSFQKDQFAT